METDQPGWRPPRRHPASTPVSAKSGDASSVKPAPPQGGTPARRRINSDGEDVRTTEDPPTGERKAKPHRGRRGGKRRTEAKKRQIEIKDKNLRELLLTVTKLLAMTAMQVKVATVACLRSALLPTACAIIADLVEEAKAYGEHTSSLATKLAEARAATKDEEEAMTLENAQARVQTAQAALQQVGPPARCAFLALLESLQKAATTPSDVKPVLADALQAHRLAPPDVAICKLASCKDPAQTKLIWQAPTQTLTAAVEMALAKLPYARILAGQAPPGYLEEDLAQWISALEIAGK